MCEGEAPFPPQSLLCSLPYVMNQCFQERGVGVTAGNSDCPVNSCILAGSIQTTPQVKGGLSLMLARTFKGCALWYLLRESCPGVDQFNCIAK